MMLLPILLAAILFSVSQIYAVSVVPFSGCDGCGIKKVLWGSNNEVLLHTSNNELYWSGDGGSTWPRRSIGIFDIYRIANTSTFIAQTMQPESVLRVSVDGGASFTDYELPYPGPGGLEFHPHIQGTFLYVVGGDAYCNVFYTSNLGLNWTMFATQVFYPDWSLDRNAATTVFGRTGWNGDFGYTPDLGKTWVTLFPNAHSFQQTRDFMWVSVYAEKLFINIHASSSIVDRSHTNISAYVKSQFPFGDDIVYTGWAVLDDSAGAGFLGVSHTAESGTILTSEYKGASFVNSLINASTVSEYFDFDKVGGIRGVYIANIVTDTGSETPPLRTFITFDNGGEWRTLVPPQYHLDGTPVTCAGECSLHLHGITSFIAKDTIAMPPFYSSYDAVGLVVAVGNLGMSLYHNPEHARTYLSRDGGASWLEFYNGTTIYEFGNYGSIIIWAPVVNTTEFWYSLDQGLTRKSYNFTSTPMVVNDIINQNDGSGRKFLLYGSVNDTYMYIFTIDFTDENTVQCTASDYEVFSPSDAHHGSENCILGATYKYLRRKRDAKCYATAQHLEGAVTACMCAYEDYECDFGYTPSPRNSTGGFSCTPTVNSRIASPPENCPAGTSYTVSTGYHLLEGNICNGGLDLKPYTRPCPVPAPPKKPTPDSTAIIVTVVVLVVVVIVVISVVLYRKPEFVRKLKGKLGMKTGAEYEPLFNNSKP